MSDHGHHDPGGHELEAINNKMLFRLLISLSAVTLLAVIAVIQWFYSQRAELQERQAGEGSFLLKQYKEEMAADLEGIEGVRKQILADPSMLAAPAAPANWIPPEPCNKGVPAAAVTASAVAPAQPAAAPAEEPAAQAVAEGEAIAVPAGEGAEPGAAEGDTKEPAADKPIAVEAKPEAAKPEAGKPEAAKPDTKADTKADTKTEQPANE